MNRSTLSAVVVALMLGSGIAGYLIGRPSDTLDKPPPARPGGAAAPGKNGAAPAPHTATPPPAPAPAPRPPSRQSETGATRGGARRRLRLSPFHHRQQPTRSRGLLRL